MEVGLTKLAAVEVERQRSPMLDASILDEVLGLSLATKAKLLELVEHIGTEVVIENGCVHVGRAEPRGPPELLTHHRHLGQPAQIVSVVAGHHVLALARPLSGGTDDCRSIGQITRPLQRRHDDGLGPIGLLAAVEQPQRLNDPTARLVVLERDGLLVEPGLGVRGGVLAVSDGNVGQISARRARDVHVALGSHGYPRGRRQKADGHVGT